VRRGGGEGWGGEGGVACWVVMGGWDVGWWRVRG